MSSRMFAKILAREWCGYGFKWNARTVVRI